MSQNNKDNEFLWLLDDFSADIEKISPEDLHDESSFEILNEKREKIQQKFDIIKIKKPVLEIYAVHAAIQVYEAIKEIFYS